MVRSYLYFNAALYLVFAIWCTLDASGTAQQIGFTGRSAGGMSEFLVVYGGMELGFAAFFVYSVRRGGERFGLFFALATYAPIVTFRIVTVALYWPVGSTTLTVASLEAILLVWGTILWRKSHY